MDGGKAGFAGPPLHTEGGFDSAQRIASGAEGVTLCHGTATGFANNSDVQTLVEPRLDNTDPCHIKLRNLNKHLCWLNASIQLVRADKNCAAYLRQAANDDAILLNKGSLAPKAVCSGGPAKPAGEPVPKITALRAVSNKLK